jgi:hypothetical protein
MVTARVNDEARIAELRAHATAHQANRGSSRGYSIRVVYWGEGGEEREVVGYITAVNVDSIRLAILNQFGGGFRTLGFRRVVSLERAPWTEATS